MRAWRVSVVIDISTVFLLEGDGSIERSRFVEPVSESQVSLENKLVAMMVKGDISVPSSTMVPSIDTQ